MRESLETKVRKFSRVSTARRESSVTVASAERPVAIEHCHLAKEIAMTERSENHFAPIGIRDRDANAPALDNIHRITGIADPEQTRAALELDGMQIAAKFLCCGIIERREERNTAQ